MSETKKVTFEESLTELENIVQQLEKGDVPLEKALSQFQRGVELSKICQQTLEKAENTLTKIMTEENQEVVFDREDETH